MPGKGAWHTIEVYSFQTWGRVSSFSFPFFPAPGTTKDSIEIFELFHPPRERVWRERGEREREGEGGRKGENVIRERLAFESYHHVTDSWQRLQLISFCLPEHKGYDATRNSCKILQQGTLFLFRRAINCNSVASQVFGKGICSLLCWLRAQNLQLCEIRATFFRLSYFGQFVQFSVNVDICICTLMDYILVRSRKGQGALYPYLLI